MRCSIIGLHHCRSLLFFIAYISFLSLSCAAQKYILPNEGMITYAHPDSLLSEIGELLDSKKPESFEIAEGLIERIEAKFLSKESKNSGDTIAYLVSQEYKASLYRQYRQHDKALKLCDSIQSLIDSWGITHNIVIAKNYSVMASTYSDLDQESQDKSQEVADLALEAYTKGPYQSVFVYKNITSNKYRAYSTSSDPGATDSTLKYLDIRKAILRDYGHYYEHLEETEHALYLGYTRFYSNAGDFSKAISYGLELIRRMNAQEKRSYKFKDIYEENLFWLSVNYYYNKQYKEALYHTKNLLSLVKKRLAPNDYIMIQYYNLMGINYEGLDKLDSAMVWYKQCRDILDDQNIRNNIYSGLLLNISSVEARTGDFESSELLLKEALRINKRIFGNSHPENSPFYLYFFEHFRMTGDQEKALTYIDSALISLEPSHTGGFLTTPELKSDRVSFETLEILHSQMTQQMVVYKEKPEDREEYLYAIVSRAEAIQKILDDQRNSLFESESLLLNSEWFKSAYETVLEALYLLYNETKDSGYLDQAISYLASGKSRLLVDEMGELQLINSPGVPDSTRTKFIQAKRKVTRLDNALNKLLAESIDSDSIRILNGQKFEWTNEYNNIKKTLRTEHPQTSPLLSPVSDLDQIKDFYEVNNDDEVLLEYFMGAHNITILAVSKSQKELFLIPRDSVFDRNLNGFLEQVSSAGNSASDQISQFQDRGYYLYQRLLSPVVKTFGNDVSKLTIIADDKLNLLPFELLLTKKETGLTSFKNAHYLVRNYFISYQLSVKSIKTEPLETNSKGILAFGYDGEGIADERSGLGGLPGAIAEVQFLKSNFRGTFYSGNDGDKQRFLEKAEDYDILHLALHGKADLNNRFNSSLIFNGDTDYSLNASDLYGFRLKPSMVVLSACESGVGKLSTAEGSFSVARGFASVGVPSIVTTLWKVNDQVGVNIVKKFYENLNQGLDKDQALQKAKIDFLESSDSNTSHPYFWGSFIVIGDVAPVELKESGKSALYLIIGSILVLLTGFLILRRRKARAI